MKISKIFLSVLFILTLSSFKVQDSHEKTPRTISRTLTVVDGLEVEKTVVLIDGTTTSEDIIQTCTFLAKENVELTFDMLSIGKRFFGILGKNRIRKAEGKIKLPDNSSEKFKAGGLTNFKYIRIQYARIKVLNQTQIEMIEIID